MKTVGNISRFLAGLLFIFLGFISYVNLFGLGNILSEHILQAKAIGVPPLTVAMSVFLCVVEFAIGIMLITNTYKKVLVSRILIGILFMFSGFVKGVDPLGTAYKIEEYMQVFGFEWAIPLTFALSVFLCTLEFTVGVLILTNSFKKIAKWLLLLMMCFFLVTTFTDAITNQVSDCGCFGDAVKLTNWQTFWKNVILLVPTLFIFFYQDIRKEKWISSKIKDWVVLGISVLVMAGFCLYNFYNEPVIDFRPWKTGTQIMPKKRGEIQSFVTYKNKQTGEEMEFPSAKLMEYYNDTVWQNTWEFKDSRVVDPNQLSENVKGFSMLDADKNDHAQTIIGNPDFQFIVTSYDLTKINEKGLQNFKTFLEKAQQGNVSVVFLTASLQEDIDQFKQKDPSFEFIEYYGADDKAIKTMMRSNPGLILLKNGTVLAKWHYNKFPNPAEIPMDELAKKYGVE